MIEWKPLCPKDINTDKCHDLKDLWTFEAPLDKIINRNTYRRNVTVGTIFYLIVSAVVLYACIQLDKVISIDLSFIPLFKNVSYRLSPELPWPIEYLSEPPASRISYTSNLSIGMFTYFLIQGIMGFTYVNLVTL